jgi:thioredoxin reductase (NADPH)
LPAPIETDAVIIGAGPVGLFQAFQLGLLEIQAHIVDALPHVGGQPVELYPDKPIYDIPAIPVCTGRELADALMRQIAPFNIPVHLGQLVTHLARRDDGRLDIRTSAGLRFITRAVFIAAGVGAFVPRGVGVAGFEPLVGSQLFHAVPEAAALAGQQVVVLGGDEAAVLPALALAEAVGQPGGPARVTLLHRRDVFAAPAADLARLEALREAGRLHVAIGQITGHEVANGRMTALTLLGSDAQTHALPADRLVVRLGLSPKLGPVADWGLALERKQLVVNTETFSTSEPGIFAVGDINTYPGKKKLLVSGFHECALAAYGAAPLVRPDKPVFLQYTTTSPRLHQLLGVATPAKA